MFGQYNNSRVYHGFASTSIVSVLCVETKNEEMDMLCRLALEKLTIVESNIIQTMPMRQQAQYTLRPLSL